MDVSRKEWLIIVLLVLLLITMVYFIYIYNTESVLCMSEPLKYAEKYNKYCSCFCLDKLK